MAIPDLRRGMLLCVVSVAAMVMATQAWDRLQGSWNFQRLERMKADWHEATRVPRDQELNEGFKLGYDALERDPASADYRFMLASMHAWREKGLRLWPEQAAAETGKVVENLKGALARRPSWFEAWILLALVKFQAGEIDRQLKAVLEVAMETGPYESAVHHGLSIVGPRIRDRVEPDLHDRIVEVLRTSLDNPHVNRFVVEQIMVTGMEETFADQLASNDDLARLVDRYLKKRNEAL